MADDVSADLRINHDDWSNWPGDIAAEIDETLAMAARFTQGGNIDLLLTGDDEIQELNSQWRNKDKPTDVLSFPSDEDVAFGDFLGDIVISYGVMSRDAEKMGKTRPAHFKHLLVHGFLHLLGYDHLNDEDAEEMETLERKILAELGPDDPYSVRLES